jgi:branched-chain amino acid transport system ATP-binding protein
MIALQTIIGGYDAETVLNGLSFTVKRGDKLALLGRNGVGKTTALRAMMGLLPVKSGRITYKGEDITTLSPRERAIKGIGYVPQTRDIFPSLSVEENLIAGLKNYPLKDLEIAYTLFPRLYERRKNGGNQLSGGEQQMLSIARALMGRPELLLLDEPLEGLAPLIRAEILKSLSQMDITLIITEQHIDEVLRVASQAIILEKGAVIYEAPAQQLRANPAILESYIGLAL